MKNLKKALLISGVISGFMLGGVAAKATEYLDNPTVKKCFACVWKNSGFGNFHYEAAAWIIKTDKGLSCSYWPATFEDYHQVYKGTFYPLKMLAIVHTHPNTAGDRPSQGDINTAKNFNESNYVISDKQISKFDPEVGKVITVADSHFIQNATALLKKGDCDEFKSTTALPNTKTISSEKRK